MLYTFVRLLVALAIAVPPHAASIAHADSRNSAYKTPGIPYLPDDDLSGLTASSDRSQIEAEGEFLEEALMGRADYHPLDVFRLLAQEAIDLKKPHLVDVNAISLQIVDDRGVVIKSFGTDSGEVFTNQGVAKYYFQLAYRNEVFMKFRPAIRSVGFVDNKVVFLEDGFQAVDPAVTKLQFVDLRAYKLAIGKTALPVFQIPLETVNERQQIELNGRDALLVKGTQINSNVLNTFSEVQQTAFDMSVSLASFETLDEAQPVIEDLQYYFERATEFQGQIIDNSSANQNSVQRSMSVLAEDMKRRLAPQTRSQVPNSVATEIQRDIMADRQKLLAQISKSISDERAGQKKFLSRLKILRAAISTPQPLGAPKLAHAMAFVASGIQGKKKYDFNQAYRHFVSSRSARMGVAIASGLALGSLYPAEASAFLYGSLDVGRTAFDAVFGTVKNLGALGREAVSATFSGFNPVHFKDAYLVPDKLYKVGIGLSAIFTTIYLAIGIPHITANTFALVKDLRRTNWLANKPAEQGTWKAFKNAFIQRQRRLQADYLSSLASDNRKGAPQEYSAEENAEIENIIRELESREKKGVVSTYLGKIFQRKQPKNMGIETFGQALRHFLFSYATFTISGKAYTQIWNTWFGMRSFVWSPSVFASVLMFPNIWNRAVQGYLPTRFNGGLRTRASQVRDFFFNRTRLNELSAFEDKMLGIEAKLMPHALKRAFHALAEHTKSLEELSQLERQGEVKKLSSEVLDEMTSKQRSFFLTYFEQTLEAATVSYLQSKGLSQNGQGDMALSSSLAGLEITENEAQALVQGVDDRQILANAQDRSQSFLRHKAFVTNAKAGLVRFLDSGRNRQVGRMLSVNRQAAKPQAMARAVRSMIASNLVDKPMELMFTFICLAGITQGILAPIQEEMFSENSWFHLSRMVFSNGFLYGVISGVFADIWMKLQQDELHEGSFDHVPSGDDAKKSFLRYYGKNTFKNPENSLWKNQMHSIKIVWANMKAAFTTMLLVNLVTLGRFDLDSYIVGYIFYYLVPLSGFAFKLEQGFELSANYYAKDIPEKYLAHPRSQEYLNKVIGKKRIRFNMFYKAYENIMGYLVFNFQQMATPQFGSRSFSRVVLGGYTWTELAVKGIEGTKEKLASIPGVNKVLDSCEFLLTNNYTDFEKVKPKK